MRSFKSTDFSQRSGELMKWNQISKLINISQAIDVKLTQITSNDSLQAIQARIRALEGLEKEVVKGTTG